MFNSISKSGLVAFVFAAITANAVVPPTAGAYAIQNANSSLLLNLNGGDPTQIIIEFPLTEPIHNFPNQLWNFIPGAGNTAVLEVVDPNTFLTCKPGALCVGDPTPPAQVWIVEPTVHGGFLIIDATSGLTLTGRGGTSEAAFLSVANPSANLEQVWAFIDISQVTLQN